MDYIFSLLSLSSILELPWSVKGPGLAIIALLLLRAIRSVISLRLIRTFTSLVYAFVIALILSTGGKTMVQLMGLEEDKPAVEGSKLTPTFPSVVRYTV